MKKCCPYSRICLRASVVQHMPKFQEALRNDLTISLSSERSADGDVVENGKVLIAPGDYLVITPERRVALSQEDR